MQENGAEDGGDERRKQAVADDAQRLEEGSGKIKISMVRSRLFEKGKTNMFPPRSLILAVTMTDPKNVIEKTWVNCGAESSPPLYWRRLQNSEKSGIFVLFQ